MTTWVDCEGLLHALLAGQLNPHEVQALVAYQGFQRRCAAGAAGDALGDWLEAAVLLNQAICNYELKIEVFQV